MQRQPGRDRLQMVLHLAGGRYGSDEVRLADVAHMSQALQQLFNRLGSLLLSGDPSQRLSRPFSSGLQLSLLGGRRTDSFEFRIAGPEPAYTTARDASLLFDVSQLFLDSVEAAANESASDDVPQEMVRQAYPLLDEWLRSLTPFARIDLTTEGPGIRRSTSFAPTQARRVIRAWSGADTIYEERIVEGVVIAADLQRRTVTLRDDLGLEIRCWIAHPLPTLALGQRVRVRGKAAISLAGRVLSVQTGRIGQPPESPAAQRFFQGGRPQTPEAVEVQTLRIPDLTDEEVQGFLESLSGDQE